MYSDPMKQSICNIYVCAYVELRGRERERTEGNWDIYLWLEIEFRWGDAEAD